VQKSIILLAALLCMSAAVPAFAEMTSAQKDECVLASRNCKTAVDDIQTQIARISKEIDKGSAVYTAEELKKLEQKLTEVKELLHAMEKR
jgi:Skp family chaperone for outer membrane proteins